MGRSGGLIKHEEKGFTLLELLFSMAISCIVIGAIMMGYQAQKKSSAAQDEIAVVQQNLRTALYFLTTDIREAGYDPLNKNEISLIFTITSVARQNGNGSITFTIDQDENGVLGPDETIQYLLYNDNITTVTDPDRPITDLGRVIGGGTPELLAENIVALGLAYAFDRDNDSDLDLSPNENIIWAIDKNGDGMLDRSLDTNDDGIIDRNDDKNGDGRIDLNDPGAALAAPVELKRIRAVRIWLLARSDSVDDDIGPRLDAEGNPIPYVVAERQITPDINDRTKWRLITTMVDCRNMGS